MGVYEESNDMKCYEHQIKTPWLSKELPVQRQQQKHYKHYSGVFIVNFEHTSHIALVFLLLTLNK